MKLKFKKLRPDARTPQYATDGAACFDLCSTHTIPGGLIKGHTIIIPTGLAFEIPAGHVMLVFSRSGHGFRHGVRLANCVGVIDSDFRGEVFVKLSHDGGDPLAITAGDRIAQAMIVPIPSVELDEVADLSETERGANGFGSTGA